MLVRCSHQLASFPGPRPAPRHLLHGKRLGPRPSPSFPSLAVRQATRSQALAQLLVTCCKASDSVPGPRPAPRHLLHGKRLGPRPSSSSPSLAARQATGSWARAWELGYSPTEPLGISKNNTRHCLFSKQWHALITAKTNVIF